MSEVKLTPMIEQYLAVKKQYADYLLMYRIGDFYECFFDDAITTSKALNITLTSHGTSAKNEGNPPMCGIPYHAFNAYIPRLIKQGFKVAVCEQMETPDEAKAKGGAKAMVRREVTRIITPGTLTEDELIGTAASNYLMAVFGNAAAVLEVSTGEFSALHFATPLEVLSFALIKNPSEILAAEGALSDEFVRAFSARISYKPASFFNEISAGERIGRFFGSVLGFNSEELCAIGAALGYIELTHIGKMPQIATPVPRVSSGKLGLDAFCVRNLEIFENATERDGASLFSIMDKTRTAVGKRLLSAWLAEPLAEAGAINERLSKVSYFFENLEICDRARELLTRVSDMERILQRAIMRRASPKDIRSLAGTLAVIPDINEVLGGFINLQSENALAELILKAVVPDAPPNLSTEGFIRDGYNPALDEYRLLQANSKQVMAEMQVRYASETGTLSLKIKYNAISGYFIEVPAGKADKLVEAGYRHRQTLVNAVRFTTDELQELEAKIAIAADKCRSLELSLFDEVVDKVCEKAADISLLAKGLASIDAWVSLAYAARVNHWCRPEVSDGFEFEIKGGRHPVVEEALKGLRGTFIPNDSDFTSSRMWLLTGPNMAGKSTFLRQNALIVIMAQTGSYIPAESAKIGVVDKLFSRVGASDNLAQGLSTFMVEMQEAAAILQQATERSFVILDELGRGTATYDGLSIAWATLEDLCQRVACRGVFATHYHEIGEAVGKIPNLSAHTVSVKEYNDEIIFMYKVEAGFAEHSYGIHVAKLAGVPLGVVKRAGQILAELENGSFGAHGADLFSYQVAEPAAEFKDELRERIAEVVLDELSPKQALELLYELKGL